MRARRFHRVIAGGAVLAFALATSGRAPAEDFDPAGRRRHATPRPEARPDRTAGPARAAAPARPDARPASSGRADEGEPSSEALIARYTRLALADRAPAFAVQRLAELYRARDGNLAKLEAMLEQRAREPGQVGWPAGLALAAVYREGGRVEEAKRLYEELASRRPREAGPLISLAELAKGKGEMSEAKTRYEQALPLVQPPEREVILRALLTASLDVKQFESAKRFHQALVRANPGSAFVRGELGRELEARGELERAEVELRALVAGSAGDNRALAPALRDLGRVLARAQKSAEALTTLRHALAAAGGEAGIRGEIFALIVDVHRSSGDLPELVRWIEAEHPADTARLATLGALYEETGQVEKALGAYRRALAVTPRNADLRVKVIHLLEAEGQLEPAIREHEALIRAAPENPDFVFELAATLIQRGERARALARLAELERRAAGDEEVLARLAEFYERADEKPRSIAVLARLASLAPGDPSHLVDLGDRYYQQGDKKRALETWSRIKGVVPNRAKALATLGEVFLDHDMPAEGLEALEEASHLEPQNVAYRKSFAAALERTAVAAGTPAATHARFEQARVLWEELLRANPKDRVLEREARTHVVTLYGLLHELESHVAPLEERLSARPPDLAAGRLLGEVQTRLRRFADAGRTLRRVAALAPGDPEALLALERVLVLDRDLPGAIDVLKRLVLVDPKRAREGYQRMAEYAAELYHDDDAIAFAARAVELSPDDAEGHRKLGAMYKKRQDLERAALELRAAIVKNDKLFPVYFELAELLLSRGETDEADRLLRRVVRAAPDEELVSQAARRSMQVNLGKGTLEKLEQDLLPIAIGSPAKTIYRRLLVELYGAMAFPLVQQARHGAPEEAERARAALSRIGARAIKPLLDALSDTRDASQQRIAVNLLGFVSNLSAGPALFAFATGPADQPLRLRAMLACGALRDAELLPKYASVLLPKDESAWVPGDPVVTAAAWSVARLGERRAARLLERLLSRPSPEVRALAAVGLGLLGNKAEAPALASLARSPEAGSLARAAAAFALGELRSRDGGDALLVLAQSGDALARRAALLALARTEDDAAPDAIADGVLAADPAVRDAAVLAAVALEPQDDRRRADRLPMPQGAVDVSSLLDGLGPKGYGAAERARALVRLAPPLRRAGLAAAATDAERAFALADALLSRGGEPAFGAFTAGIEALAPDLRAQAEQAAESIARAVIPSFLALAKVPAPALRARALQFLGTRPEDEAQSALVAALRDEDETTCRAAIAAVGPRAGSAVVRALSSIVERSAAWPLRVRSAEALGRIGARAAGVFDALAHVARADDPGAKATDAVYAPALVREAALRALAGLDPDRVRGLLLERAARDPEPALRALAKGLARPDPSP